MNIPLQLQIRRMCRSDNLEVILVLMEEIMLGKQLRPVRVVDDNLVDDIRA